MQDKPLSPEELLRPRVKIASLYPGLYFEIGDVLMQDLDTIGEVWVLTSQLSDQRSDRNWIDKTYIKAFSNIFKPLAWWEDRDQKDMPEYVKYWDISLYFPVGRVCRGIHAPFKDNDYTASHFLPATLDEYNDYIKTQTNNG